MVREGGRCGRRINFWVDVVIGVAFVAAAVSGVVLLVMGSGGGYRGAGARPDASPPAGVLEEPARLERHRDDGRGARSPRAARAVDRVHEPEPVPEGRGPAGGDQALPRRGVSDDERRNGMKIRSIVMVGLGAGAVALSLAGCTGTALGEGQGAGQGAGQGYRGARYTQARDAGGTATTRVRGTLRDTVEPASERTGRDVADAGKLETLSGTLASDGTEWFLSTADGRLPPAPRQRGVRRADRPHARGRRHGGGEGTRRCRRGFRGDAPVRGRDLHLPNQRRPAALGRRRSRRGSGTGRGAGKDPAGTRGPEP